MGVLSEAARDRRIRVWAGCVRSGSARERARAAEAENKAERAEGSQVDTGRKHREREISEKKKSRGSRHVTKEGRSASSLGEWS